MLLKARKETTNLEKVFMKIVKIFSTSSGFREVILLIAKEIVINYLKIV